jgi:ATP-dependent DNA helicase RecG
LVKLGLNPRQVKAVLYVKEKGKITNAEYQEINGTIDQTALRDLKMLVEKGILKRSGNKKSAYYELVNVG